jgi:hypothetical protein
MVMVLALDEIANQCITCLVPLKSRIPNCFFIDYGIILLEDTEKYFRPYCDSEMQNSNKSAVPLLEFMSKCNME